jgi:hypothetical protein
LIPALLVRNWKSWCGSHGQIKSVAYHLTLHQNAVILSKEGPALSGYHLCFIPDDCTQPVL